LLTDRHKYARSMMAQDYTSLNFSTYIRKAAFHHDQLMMPQ